MPSRVAESAWRLRGPNALTAHNEEFFTEAELYRALSWGMPDSEARKLAKHLTDDPAVIATLPTFRDLGPIATNYSEDLLILLSLVSDETNRKVERRLAETRRGKAWNPDEREQWERRRSEIRTGLVKAGKLPSENPPP